jgi:hypothetical protein
VRGTVIPGITATPSSVSVAGDKGVRPAGPEEFFFGHGFGQIASGDFEGGNTAPSKMLKNRGFSVELRRAT